MVSDAIAGEGVVQIEYGSLIALEIEPGIDQRRLADAVGIDPSNASLVVERLHSMGLIERRINGVDRRARELYLTAKGKALWRRARVKGKVTNAKILAPLASHERELFLDLLVRVIQGNWTHARPGARPPQTELIVDQQDITGRTNMRAFSRLAASALVLVVALTSLPAMAQTWPQRTVRLVVPLPPGSGTDIVGRLLAERLSQRWGQPVVIENRQGADGIPAVTSVLAARDTHLLLASFAGIITVNPLLHERLPYDPAKDLAPIVPIADNFLGAAVSGTLKVNSLDELVKAAKAQPGKLNWAATPGVPYYAVLALLRSAGIDMAQVSYRDFGPAYQDMNQGRLHLAATGVPLLVPHHRAGTAKLLFVTNRERSPQAPEVPTAREAGYPDLTFEGTVGIYGWRGLPADIQKRISDDVQAVTSDDGFRAKVATAGSAARSGSSAEFAAAIEEQRSKIADLHKTVQKR